MGRITFGKRVPAINEIVKIDGKNVVDSEGNVFDRRLVKTMDLFGLRGYELVSTEDIDGPSDPAVNLEDQ